MFKCKFCNKTLKTLNWKHLASHSLTLEEYIKMFGLKENFKNPIDLKNENNFLKSTWYSSMFSSFRQQLLTNGRKCPVFDLEME